MKQGEGPAGVSLVADNLLPDSACGGQFEQPAHAATAPIGSDFLGDVF
jgi:hypothetical protein